jgi:uncharacterized protein YbaR (Trm112 family)
MTIPETIRQILVCPRCHGVLTDETGPAGAIGLACAACGIVYPVRDGIPVLLVDQAQSR